MRAEETVKRGVFALAAVLVLVLSIGFLAAAGWLYLSSVRGAIFASAIIGILLLGVAVLFAILARRRRIIVPAPVATPVQPAAGQTSSLLLMTPVLAQAFMTGLTVGLSGKKKD